MTYLCGAMCYGYDFKILHQINRLSLMDKVLEYIEDLLPKLCNYLAEYTNIMIGEIGLDYSISTISRKLQQNIFICAGSTVQRAGIAALQSAKEDVTQMRKTYNKRRKS